ncbi:MAG TPA: TonB-dependent receptor [Candidatus Polarisedimenticolia bacterium]|nr:TonB-dependent receptor [Candidatus Polarisedimenticolia bacterium]
MPGARARRSCILLAILLFVSPAVLHAQSTLGTLVGTVVDKNGEVLPGVTITLENPQLGFKQVGFVTGAQGEFRISGIPAGKGYLLGVRMPGSQVLQFTLEIPAGKTIRQNVTLLQAITEIVKVIDTTPAVEIDKPATVTKLSAEFIDNLPLLGTDYQDILTAAPGVQDSNGTGNPNINGGRDTDVMTLVDGASTTDPFDGHFGQNLNAESIGEIEIISAGAGAQFSRAQAGFISIVTKSGGNEFRGTFTFTMRSYLLDGDGAGIDPAEIRGGLGQTDSLSDTKFTNLYPFLSVSGPIVHDRAWYYFAPEFIQEETPINAGTQAYVQRLTDTRVTAKLTWQVTATNKLSLTGLYDGQDVNHQGVASNVALESGFSFQRGGPTLTLQDSAVFSPTVSLETTLARFDQTFRQIPTIDPDTNGNGILTVDDRPDLGGNQNGFVNLKEGDPGSDWDDDGRWDVFEDANHNGTLDGCTVDEITGARTCAEDRDRDGRLTGVFGCEGQNREDFNCNGKLDFEADLDEDGILDPEEDIGIQCSNPALCHDGMMPDSSGRSTAGNGRFDTEDHNANHILDDTPFPNWMDANGNGIPERGEFTAPASGDGRYTINTNTNRTSGPYFRTYSDSRTRDSWKEDLSYFLSDLGGTHELRAGFAVEREGYDAEFSARPIWQVRLGALNPTTGQIGGTINAFLPTRQEAANSASSENFGIYLNDTFKPLSNLTLNVGIRFDREAVSSHGYEFFDPAGQRREFDTLANLTGIESSGDLNADGMLTRSLDADPLYGSIVTTPADPLRVPVLNSHLSVAAAGRLTRHNFVSDILSTQLGGQGIADPGLLRAGRPRQPEDLTLTNNNLSPRLSLSWDPAADGKSKATVSWGRFYDRLFLQTVIGEEGPDFLTPYYGYDSDGINPFGFPDNQVGRVISQAPPSANQVDRGLRTPYSDELTLGYEREIAPEVTVSFTYIRRKFRDQLQDVDVNHSTRRPSEFFACGNLTPSGYCDEFGLNLVRPPQGNGGEAGNGPDERVPDGHPDLYINNYNFNQIFRLGNLNTQDYTGYQLHLVRRLSRKWQMDASYVYSRATGQAEGFNAESGDDPALTELRNGYLNFDQTHVAKFFATAFLPGDWRLGGGVTWSSGLPYSQVNRFTSADNVDFPQTRRVYGAHQVNSGLFFEEDRNAHRNPAAYTIDVRTEKQLVLGKMSAGAFFEIFNLLNTDDLRVFEIDDQSVSLQSVEQRQFGRRFQFGMRMNF